MSVGEPLPFVSDRVIQLTASIYLYIGGAVVLIHIGGARPTVGEDGRERGRRAEAAAARRFCRCGFKQVEPRRRAARAGPRARSEALAVHRRAPRARRRALLFVACNFNLGRGQ